MKVPYSWLKDYVDIDLPASELAEKLFSCGFEVEEIIYLGEKINRVVVGEVTALTKHPDSDHMHICTVDCGEQYGRAIQIVTGAPNVYVGMRTPVALDNSTVAETNPAALEKCPDGVKKIRENCAAWNRAVCCVPAKSWASTTISTRARKFTDCWI